MTELTIGSPQWYIYIYIYALKLFNLFKYIVVGQPAFFVYAVYMLIYFGSALHFFVHWGAKLSPLVYHVGT